jgi:hypothetical protein
MRPFGHRHAKAARDARDAPLESPLKDAWEEFSLLKESLTKNRMYELQIERFREYGVSSTDLAAHILSFPEMAIDSDDSLDLGLFVSAGYQALAEREIVYDLHTPWLSFIGYHLKQKHLIITGSVGDFAGGRMLGRLTIKGSAGAYAANGLVGTAENYGTAGKMFGLEMVGHCKNYGRAGYGLAHFQVGILTTNRPCEPRGLFGTVNGEWYEPSSWHILPSLRQHFIEEMEHIAENPWPVDREKMLQRYEVRS